MATLEKIRSKSVFLFIIIIIALLAFILGDFLNSGRSYFGTGTTMYKAGNVKVDYTDYQNASQNIQAGQDGDKMQQLMLQQIAQDKLLNKQFELLGIEVTDNELSEIMTNYLPLDPQVQQVAMQLGLPATDRMALLDAIKNPSRYGLAPQYQEMLANQWKAEEDNLEANIKMQVFNSLMSGLFTANELDAKAMYDNSMVHTPMEFVKVSVVGVPDEDIEVTDAEIRSKWQQEKAKYEVAAFLNNYVAPDWTQNPNSRGMIDMRPVAINEPVKVIDYVVVPIAPSAADYAAAAEEVAVVKAALEEKPGVDGLLGHDKFHSESALLTKNDIKSNSALRELADSNLSVGKVQHFAFNRAQNLHTLVKVTGEKTAVDSVKTSMFYMPIAEADSIMGLIASGTTIDELVAAHAGQGFSDREARIEAGASSFQSGDPLAIPAIRNGLATADLKKVQLYTDSLQGVAIAYQVNERQAPETFYNIAYVTYNVDPSAQTLSDLQMALNSFIASNPTAEMFAAKADSLYQLRSGVVTASTPLVGNVAGTRPAVKWALDHKPGKVSRVFVTPTAYVAVAVKEAFEDYVPYNSTLIKDQLAAEVRKDKKAAKLIDEYAGKANTLEEYAQLMNTVVQTESDVVFNSPRIAGHYNNVALQAKLGAAEAGQLVGPFQNDNEVVVFVAGDNTTNPRPYQYELDAPGFTRDFGMSYSENRVVNPMIFYMLVGDNKVKNTSAQFGAQED